MMSKGIIGQGYTMPVCAIVEQIWHDGHPDETTDTTEVPTWKEGLEHIDEMIEYASEEIFYFDYPTYGDANDKKHLECHILESYYTRDICCDSMMRWVMFLKERLQDIMPKYVALYNAQVQLIASDILDPYHLAETKDVISNKSTIKVNESETNLESKSSTDTSSTSNANSIGQDDINAKDIQKFSNTPQALASAVDSGSDIPMNYLSNMGVNTNESENSYSSHNSSADQSTASNSREDTNSFNSTDTGNENKTDRIIREIKGNLSKMNNAQLIKDYQDVILNIEKMITDEIRDLFYLVY